MQAAYSGAASGSGRRTEPAACAAREARARFARVLTFVRDAWRRARACARSYCIGLFAAPFIQSVCENHQTYVLYLAGTRMRNVLMAAIYRKCLHLSNSSLQVREGFGAAAAGGRVSQLLGWRTDGGLRWEADL